QPAQASALDVSFRTLTEHTALAGGATVQAVGVFDPAQVASAPATPSPYSPELLTGADQRSRQLLGGQPVAPHRSPARVRRRAPRPRRLHRRLLRGEGDRADRRDRGAGGGRGG